jgi:type IV secretory pathway VirB3-like protein
MSDSNGTDPVGYRATIHQALIKPGVMIMGVPRELLGILLVFCLGIGMLFDSYGAIFVYVGLHGVLAALTWHDPFWPHVWKEVLQYRMYILWRQVQSRWL